MEGFRLAVISAMAFILISACASSGGMKGGDNEIYEVSYSKMVNVVQQAIKGQGLNINYSQKSDEGKKLTILFSEYAYVGDQSVQRNQATITVSKIDSSKTRVVIENPDYHFSIPSHQRKDYKRVLTSQIKDILNG